MRSFLLLLSVLVLTACTAAPPAEEVVVDDTTQKEADIQAFNQLLELWDEAAAAGDVDAMLALVTDDYIRMLPDKPAIEGKKAFRDSLQTSNVMQTSNDEYSFQDGKNVIEEIRLAGDWAYVRGSYSATIVLKAGGDPIHVTSKWIDIRERQADGSWKISRCSANWDAPLDLDQ